MEIDCVSWRREKINIKVRVFILIKEILKIERFERIISRIKQSVYRYDELYRRRKSILLPLIFHSIEMLG